MIASPPAIAANRPDILVPASIGRRASKTVLPGFIFPIFTVKQYPCDPKNYRFRKGFRRGSDALDTPTKSLIPGDKRPIITHPGARLLRNQVEQLRDNENLLRARVFDFAARSIATHVDVSTAGVEWIKNETGPVRHRFCHRKLRGTRGG